MNALLSAVIKSQHSAKMLSDDLREAYAAADPLTEMILRDELAFANRLAVKLQQLAEAHETKEAGL